MNDLRISALYMNWPQAISDRFADPVWSHTASGTISWHFPHDGWWRSLKILIVWPSPYSHNPLQVERIKHSLLSGITHLLPTVLYYLPHNFKGPHTERLADLSCLYHCTIATMCLWTSGISPNSVLVVIRAQSQGSGCTEGKYKRRIVRLHLHVVFVTIIHSLRLDKCVLLYWILCQC
jgi:hypothetical protein